MPESRGICAKCLRRSFSTTGNLQLGGLTSLTAGVHTVWVPGFSFENCSFAGILDGRGYEYLEAHR